MDVKAVGVATEDACPIRMVETRKRMTGRRGLRIYEVERRDSQSINSYQTTSLDTQFQPAGCICNHTSSSKP